MSHQTVFQLVLQHLHSKGASSYSSDDNSPSLTSQQRPALILASPQRLPLMFTLPQVSKSVRQAMAEQCMGQFSVSVCIKSRLQAASFTSWLQNPTWASRGHFCRSLHLGIDLHKAPACGDEAVLRWAQFLFQEPESAEEAHAAKAGAAAATAAIAAALRGAASHAAKAANLGRLQLQEFSTGTPCTSILEALAAPSCEITSLQLYFGEDSCYGWTRQSMGELGRALSGLTGLRSLDLASYEPISDKDDFKFMGFDELAKHLSALKQLTSLDTSEIATDEQQWLPAQLLELTFYGHDMRPEAPHSYFYDHRGDNMQLSHLTALTKMTYNGGSVNDGEHGTHHAVELADDHHTLPPNLLEVHVPNCCDCSAVLALKRLQSLIMDDCRLSAEQLQQLSSLSSLTEVQLMFPEDDIDYEWESYYAAEAAAGWKAVPLKSLSFHVDLDAAAAAATAGSPTDTGGDSDSDAGERNETLLQHLGLQTGLTRLRLSINTSAKGLGLLAAPLQQLTNLQCLYLSVYEEWAHSLRTVSGGTASLVDAIVSLPHISSINLADMPGDFVAAVRKRLRAGSCKAVLHVE